MTLQSSVDFATTMLRDMNIEHRIRLIETRDAAVRADQARRDVGIMRAEIDDQEDGAWDHGWNAAITQLSRKIERCAGIGKEKGDD